jgi:hypothetical protein
MIGIQPDGLFLTRHRPNSISVTSVSDDWIHSRLFVNHPLENTMKKALLITSLFAAVALSACGKKEEAPVAAPAAPAAAPAADAATPAAPADAAAAPAAAPAADAAKKP